MKTLFDETAIGNMKLKNRFVRSATWEGMADGDGRLTARLTAVYEALAKGGVGLIISGATCVAADATRLPGMAAIYDDSFIGDWRRLTDMVHGHGCPIVMQLSFAGKGGGRWSPADAAAAERGVDTIEVSGGEAELKKYLGRPHGESIFREAAAVIAAAVSVPIILVGHNRTPALMTDVLNTTGIEYFALSRPLISEPDLVNRWCADAGKKAACVSCNGCFREGGNTCVLA